MARTDAGHGAGPPSASAYELSGSRADSECSTGPKDHCLGNFPGLRHEVTIRSSPAKIDGLRDLLAGSGVELEAVPAGTGLSEMANINHGLGS